MFVIIEILNNIIAHNLLYLCRMIPSDSYHYPTMNNFNKFII